MSEKIILIGGGGHCKSCIDVIEDGNLYEIAGILDLPRKKGEKVQSYAVIGNDEDIPRLIGEGHLFLITMGHIKDNGLRLRAFNLLKQYQAKMPAIISPRAYVSRRATVGTGTIIMPGVIVNASATIGRNCIINSKALIEHDVVVGDNCHISTGAILNGGVTVGENTFVGSNSVTREGIEIGAGAVIGCGVTVIKTVPTLSLFKG